jgi:hypothetical protein
MFTHAFVETPELPVSTQEDGTRHYVTPAGQVYESVTTFIGKHWDKAFLVAWKKRLGEAKAEAEGLRARNRGSALHKTIEQYLLNDETYRQTLSTDPQTKVLFVQVKPKLNLINNIRMLEKSIYSDELKLAGTPDCIADYDGVLATIDFKGSTREKQEKWITTYWLQAAIYSVMYNERYGEMPQQSVILIATEEHPLPSVFIEPTYKGLQRLQEFMDNPIKFQADLKKAEKEAKVKK